MKYLLDTHILLWSFVESEKLSKNTRSILLDDDNVSNKDDIGGFYAGSGLWNVSKRANNF
jgi:hypothetical protein